MIRGARKTSNSFRTSLSDLKRNKCLTTGRSPKNGTLSSPSDVSWVNTPPITTTVLSLINNLVVIEREVIGGFRVEVFADFFSTETVRMIFPSPTMLGVTISLMPAFLNLTSVPPLSYAL